MSEDRDEIALAANFDAFGWERGGVETVVLSSAGPKVRIPASFIGGSIASLTCGRSVENSGALDLSPAPDADGRHRPPGGASA
jgi:hypothetical protein